MAFLPKAVFGRGGFTFIELLIVIAVLSVLSAVALAQFSEYRKKGYDAIANHDLGTALVGQEALFASTQQYASCVDDGCMTAIPGYRRSQMVSISVTADNSAAEPFYSATTSSSGGTGEVFSFSSDGT